MSPREMSADHLWSLTIPVSPTDPKLTPKVTPYGADALAIPGHPWTRKSAIPSAKMHRWTPSDAVGTAGTDLFIRVSLVRSQRGPPNRINNLEDHRSRHLPIKGPNRVQRSPAFSVCRPTDGRVGGSPRRTLMESGRSRRQPATPTMISPRRPSLLRRPSRDRSIRMISDHVSGNGRTRTASEWAA